MLSSSVTLPFQTAHGHALRQLPLHADVQNQGGQHHQHKACVHGTVLGGALLGFIWAVLLLFAAVWLMQRFNWVVTPELIRDSILLKFFAENNPIGLIAAL